MCIPLCNIHASLVQVGLIVYWSSAKCRLNSASISTLVVCMCQRDLHDKILENWVLVVLYGVGFLIILMLMITLKIMHAGLERQNSCMFEQRQWLCCPLHWTSRFYPVYFSNINMKSRLCDQYLINMDF